MLGINLDESSSLHSSVFVSQDLIVDQTIEKVSFCAPDRNYDKAFSYICRDGTTRRWMCHCFMALKDSVRGDVRLPPAPHVSSSLHRAENADVLESRSFVRIQKRFEVAVPARRQTDVICVRLPLTLRTCLLI